MNQFKTDMETVLREVGIGDLAIPKKVRALAAPATLCLTPMRRRLRRAKPALAAAIAAILPLEPAAARAASEPLASYVWGSVSDA